MCDVNRNQIFQDSQNIFIFFCFFFKVELRPSEIKLFLGIFLLNRTKYIFLLQVKFPSVTQEEEQGWQISPTLHLWHTQTHTHTQKQETHLKSLFVSVSISLYTSCTAELIEKVRRLRRNDRTKRSVTVSSAETTGMNKAPPNFSSLHRESSLSFMRAASLWIESFEALIHSTALWTQLLLSF